MGKRVYTFTVVGKPVGFKRPDNRWQGGRRTPDDYRAYRELVSTIAKVNIDMPMDLVDLTIDVHIPCRIKKRKTMCDKILEPKRRTDLDNIVKAFMDSMNGIAYKDDVSVIGLSADYHFHADLAEPYVSVRIIERDFQYVK